MANIAILIDFCEGHIFPTFRIAKGLRARGHNVCYLGVPDTADVVRAQGFDFIDVFSDVMPEGSAQRLRMQVGQDFGNQKLMNVSQNLYFGPLVCGDTVSRALARLQPDVMLVLSFFTAEALAIRYRYGIPVVMLTPNVRAQSRAEACRAVIEQVLDLKSGAVELLEYIRKSGAELRSLADLGSLILSMPELTLLPQGFEMPHRPKDPHTHYIGAGVDLDRVEQPFQWERIDSTRPIIYVCLGTQVWAYGETARRFFRLLIEAASLKPQWQFIISTGRNLDRAISGSVADHIYICDWAPQLAILARANLMVTHGGMGAVKECILTGIPMLVLPLMHDQFECASRVVHHELGLQADITTITPVALAALMEQLVMQESFRRHVYNMRETFLRGENMPLAIQVVEQAAAH